MGPDADTKGRAGQRYRKRLSMLEAAGYFTSRRGTAPAGDTIEIVERKRPGPGQPAGLIVRATARYCASYAGERTRIPAARLLES